MSKILEEITNNNTNSQTQNFQNAQVNSENQEPNLMAILGSVLTPLIPVFVAKLTGQKLPMTSLVPQSQSDPLEKLAPILQSMINTQNILLQEVSLLRNNAQNIANSFQNLRLTHEKKQLEFNPNQNLENHE
ncbi:MAG: hypothetical protein LBR43_02550 [Spiroplasmataceae bacterium]|jgi:hypothetical protein|nr:hypothetical protein [Spiroplasmataceae bacterium]